MATGSRIGESVVAWCHCWSFHNQPLKIFPFPVNTGENLPLFEKENHLNLNFHDLGTKAANVPGCTFFRLQFDEKMWISSEGKWLGTFLLSIFPCHEMDVVF